MMLNLDKLFCRKTDTIKSVMLMFNDVKKFNLPNGIGLVLNDSGQLQGTISEGDIRRALLKGYSLSDTIENCFTKNPITFPEGMSMTDILDKLPVELINRNRKASKYLSKLIIVNDNYQPVRVFDYHELWELSVATHRHIVVVGLGYVGLTMAVVMADAGFMVTGVEVDENKYNLLSNAESYIHEIGLQEMLSEQLNKNLFISKDMPEEADVFIISVGTPVGLDENGNVSPVFSFILDASEKIGRTLKNGNLVILRSTVPIGTSRNIVLKQLELHSGLRCGTEFYLSFAPERTAEGKALKELRSLPQIIGGFDKDSLGLTSAIFRDLTPTIVKLDSLEAAEMAKLMNNTFRDYIFAYANQMSKIASEYNINIFNVINAANQGYVRDPIPLPSPGVGGPCLTKDPFIFASVTKQLNISSDLFLLSREINESMHNFIYNRVVNSLLKCGKNLEDTNLLVAGLAFKGNPETGDLRNSTSIDIAYLFKPHVKNLYGYDPIANDMDILSYGLVPFDIKNGFGDLDVVLFLNNNKDFENINVFTMVRQMREKPIIFDGWDLFRWKEIIEVKPSTYIGLSIEKTTIH
jgi:UDP-N-acetyl-D-mannosaminuronic acid dehydrogenase